MNDVKIQILKMENTCDKDLFNLTFSLNKDTTEAPFLKVVIEGEDGMNWFIENENSIKNDVFPFSKYETSSISNSIAYFFDVIEPNLDQEVEIDTLFDYRQKHGLRFAFRGQDIPDMYIGKFKGKYEISSSDKKQEIRYIIDINFFFDEIKKLRSQLV